MAIPDLEEQVLRLSPNEKLHLIQLLAQSLSASWVQESQHLSDSLSNFFRQSPLAQIAESEELDLSRDRSLPGHRLR
ncbi:MAG: hypothetical protein HC920_20335 [Oscillatoriales cyanobacterium SM2_3_0]|nr:hypothetical protein [Oscillatoriales cyanobacterium SM2_3_0]